MAFNLQQVLDQFILKPNNRYRLLARLNGHKGPVNCFAFNKDSSLLASGGDDQAVRVWDVNDLQCIQTIADRNCRWGQITCLQFIVLDATSDWMFFGTGRGRLLIYRRLRKLGAQFVEISSSKVFTPGDSVESFCFDPVHQRLIVTSHFGMIKMYEVNAGMLIDLWTDEMNDAIPRVTLFVDKGNSVIVYGLETGIASCRDSQTATEKYARNLKSPIGNIAVCPVYGHILVDNMTNGFDLYNLSRTVPSKSFMVPTTKQFTKKGVFGEKGNTVVTGSDHGKVYVFVVNKTEPIQTLEHGREHVMIQAVETTTVADRHLICSASSENSSSICVWEKPVRNAQNAPQQGRRDSLAVLLLFNAIIIAFIWSYSTWAPTLQAKYNSVAAAVSGFVNTEHAIFDAGPELPKFKLPETKPDSIEKILNMDEETFRKLFNMPKVEVDLQRSGDQEMNDLD